MTPHDPTLMTHSMVTGLQGLLVRTAGGTGEPAGEFSQTEDFILPEFTLLASTNFGAGLGLVGMMPPM